MYCVSPFVPKTFMLRPRWPGLVAAMLGLSLLASMGNLDLQAGEDAPAQTTPTNLDSPHHTMETFVNSMFNYQNSKKEGNTEKATKLMKQAIGCMDLAGANIDINLHEKYANDLKFILDRCWFYTGNNIIPKDFSGDRYDKMKKVKGQSTALQVSLSRQPNGIWLIDKEMISRIQGMRETVSSWPILKGISVPEFNTFGQWLGDKIPKPYTNYYFFLKVYQWMGILILIILGFTLDLITGIVIRKYFIDWLKRNEINLAKHQDRKIERPFGLAVMATLWWVGLYWLNLPVSVHNFLSKIALFFMAFSVVWAAYRSVDLICAYLSKMAEATESKMDDLLVPLIRKILKVFVVVFGLVFIADNLGLPVLTMVAGLGIGGVAFAFASKDTVENLFGSITVLLDHPFNIGDWVVVGDLEGTVEEVGFRSTRIRTFYNSLMTVPNAHFVTASVDNYGARIKRRIKCHLGVTYGTSPAKVEAFCEGIRELILRHPYTRKDYFHVYFNQFGPSSLDILLYAFVEVPDWATELRERERLFLDIMRLAETLGVEFAYPTQTLHIESHAMQKEPATPPERGIDNISGITEAKAFGTQIANDFSKVQYGPNGSKPIPVEFNYQADKPADRAGNADAGE